MDGGTGVGFIDDTLNVVTNVATGGLVGYDPNNGGFGAGELTQAGTKVVKDATGATAAEEANALAAEEAEKARQQLQQDRVEARATEQRNAIAASRGAAAARGVNTPRRNTNTSSLTGDTDTDFLGI